MSLTRKQRRATDPKRHSYAVFKKRRRRVRFFILVLLLAALALWGLGAYLSPVLFEEPSDGSLERVDTPAVQEAPEEPVTEKKAAEEEEDGRAAAVPDDPTLYLTVPRLGLYGHTVRNDDSEAALSVGAIKVPATGFPWQEEDTNTYIACHRIGWPGTESYNQCLDLPSMQKGDEVFLADTNGTAYRYRVSEVFAVSPDDTWVTAPIPGRDVVSLQTCTETVDDWWTMGPRLFDGGPESGRLIVRADRVS